MRYELGLKDIYFGLCCIINYKGLLLHAQVMTPGIIFNSEHLIVYGEYDEGRIRDSDEFKNEIRPIMKKLDIGSNNIIFQEKEAVDMSEVNPLDPMDLLKKNEEVKTIEKELKEYLGHPEVKGVKGVDKRNYLFDLVHIMPRDLNFDNTGALVTPDLISMYQSHLMNESLKLPKNKEKIAELQKNIDEIVKANKNSKDMFKVLEKPFEEREAFFNNLEKSIKEKLSFNTVYKTDFEVKDPKKEDIEMLENLASFAKNECIDKFLTYCHKEEDVLPCDSESLEEQIKKYGLSPNYYSFILERIDRDYKGNNLSWLKDLIYREMLVKSAVSIYNDNLKCIPSSYSQSFSAYFLNIFLGHSNLIKALDYFNHDVQNNVLKFSKPDVLSKTNSGEISPTNNKTTKDKTVTNDDKNKKKKRRKHKGTNKPEFSNNMRYFIGENLIGSMVNTLIDWTEESNLFIKATEVSFFFI